MQNAMRLAGAFFAGAVTLLTAVTAATAQAGPVDLDTAVQMAAEMSPDVRTLSRDVTTYHWQPRDKVGLPTTGEIDAQDVRALRYFQGVAGSFWGNLLSYGLMMGNGLYVATDPVASQGFGREDWALLTVRLPEGTRLFDARSPRAFSETLRHRLEALGCPQWSNAAIALMNFQLPNEICAGTFRRAARLLGMQGAVYDWGGRPVAACSARTAQWGPAMVLHDPDLASGVHVLVKERPVREEAEIHDLRVRIEFFFRMAAGGNSALWPSIPATETPLDLIEWIQSHTYFCDGMNWEDFLPDQLVFTTSELAEKREELDEKAALVGARLGRAIDPTRFRGALAARYFTPNELSPSRLPELSARPDFQAWVRVQTQEISTGARRRAPLSAAIVTGWARAWTPAGGSAPVAVAERAPALAALVDELNAALFDPRHASARDKPLLRDTEALVRAYHTRWTEVAPLNFGNERLARAVVDYVTEVRGWPPILLRGPLDVLEPLGALKGVLVMDRCLDRVLTQAHAPWTPVAPECEAL